MKRDDYYAERDRASLYAIRWAAVWCGLGMALVLLAQAAGIL